MTRQPPLGVVAGRAPQVSPGLWYAVTVQVAWTLMECGARVGRVSLRDARDHVLLGLNPATSTHHAADVAVMATRRFVAAARGGTHTQADETHRVTDELAPPSNRWRRSLEGAAVGDSRVVFREHYANQRPLDAIQGASKDSLLVARAGLRAALRDVARRDDIPVDRWTTDDVDTLLSRLACLPPGRCPPAAAVLDGQHPEHVNRCVLCDRARRLMHAGTLRRADLVLEAPMPWPSHHGPVLVLHFHPDQRQDRERLARELSQRAFPVGTDLLFVDFGDPEPVREVLIIAAEAGLPERHHLRGAVVQGRRRWSDHGLLGPAVASGYDAVRTTPWGHVDTLGELPPPLPPPPSSRPLWLAAAALAALTVGVAWGTQPTGDPTTLHTAFTPGRGGVWTEFDVQDDALVTVIREAGGHLDVVLASHSAADKASLAVGDGTYRLHTMGGGALVAAHAAPLADLAPMLRAAEQASDPVADLARRLQHVSRDVQLAAYPHS